MEQNKTGDKNNNSFINKNLIFWKLIFSLSFILIGMILLIDSSAHLYGIYIGLFSSWVSLLVYYFFEKLTKKAYSPNTRVMLSWFIFIVIRWVILLLVIFLIVFLVNLPNITEEKRLKLLLEPINVILVILSYQTFTLGVIFSPLTKIY